MRSGDTELARGPSVLRLSRAFCDMDIAIGHLKVW
jgi:hypothetical protein